MMADLFKDGSYSWVDDVSFVVVLLDDLAGLFKIDPGRIYACGFSNGAQFSYRLASQLSDRIAAIAAVAGQRPVNDSLDPPPARPISIMQFSRLQDTIARYHGGSPSTQGYEALLKTYWEPVEDPIQSRVVFNECSLDLVKVKRIGFFTCGFDMLLLRA
jgi:polyhydroxybutyrate depolymerase